jgi:hypothetical protein
MYDMSDTLEIKTYDISDSLKTRKLPIKKLTDIVLEFGNENAKPFSLP